jgi:hypothetical protein
MGRVTHYTVQIVCLLLQPKEQLQARVKEAKYLLHSDQNCCTIINIPKAISINAEAPNTSFN